MALKERTKRNDTKPLQVTIQRRDRVTGVVTPVDLTGCTVRFMMRVIDAPPLAVDLLVIDGKSVNVTNASLGECEYRWLASETAVSGLYRCEFEVTDAGGIVTTYPEKNYILLTIQEDLGPV